MKKLFLAVGIGVCMLSSCAKEWSDADQKTFMDNCLQYAQEDNDDICSCGLQRAMEDYDSFEEAQEAMDKMNEREVIEFLAECL